MFAIIGIVVVFGSVLAGYLMEHGNVRVLIQPAELVLIAGAAIGTVLVANPLHILKQIVAGLVGVFGSSKFKSGPLQVSCLSQGPPRPGLLLRHDAHGRQRGGSL